MNFLKSLYILNKNSLRTFEYRIVDWTIRFRATFALRRHPLRSQLNPKPFMIIGSGRSGTTLLRRIISSHPELIIPPENYKLSSLVRLHRRYGGTTWKDFAGIVYSSLEYQKDYDTYNIGSLEELVMQARKWEKEKRTVADLVDGFYQLYLNKHKPGASRWGDKTPLNTLFLDDINRIFPGAQYIHVIRDPYDVVSSYVRSGLSPTYLHAAKRWVVAVNAARKFGRRYPERYLEIRYEDLVLQPNVVARKICAFLCVDYVEGMEDDINHKLGDVEKLAHHENVLRPISIDNIGKGKQSMTQEELACVKDVVELINY